MKMRRRHKPFCGCTQPVKEIVHPVKENVVHCCSEETVKHIHPSHTHVMNHHLIKNEHYYPHSTSYGNTVNEVNVCGGAGPSQVAGAMSPGMPGTGGQVAGAMNYGMMGAKGQVAGTMDYGKMPHHKHHKHHKWC